MWLSESNLGEQSLVLCWIVFVGKLHQLFGIYFHYNVVISFELFYSDA